MSRPAPTPVESSPDPSPEERPATARARVEGQLDMLERLAQIGMALAEAAGRRGLAAADDPGAAGAERDAGLAFAKAARAVRMTIALQSRLMETLAALGRDEAKAHAERAAARRDHIRRSVERAAETGGEDELAAYRLGLDVRERLADDYADEDVAGLPVAEIVECICRDLDLSPEWTAWAVEIAGRRNDPCATACPAGPGAPDRAPAPAPAAAALGGLPTGAALHLSG